MINMKFIILGKNIEVTAGLKTAVEDKIGKLEKYFTPETEVHVTLSVVEEEMLQHIQEVHGGAAGYEEEEEILYPETGHITKM